MQLLGKWHMSASLLPCRQSSHQSVTGLPGIESVGRRKKQREGSLSPYPSSRPDSPNRRRCDWALLPWRLGTRRRVTRREWQFAAVVSSSACCSGPKRPSSSRLPRLFAFSRRVLPQHAHTSSRSQYSVLWQPQRPRHGQSPNASHSGDSELLLLGPRAEAPLFHMAAVGGRWIALDQWMVAVDQNSYPPSLSSEVHCRRRRHPMVLDPHQSQWPPFPYPLSEQYPISHPALSCNLHQLSCHALPCHRSFRDFLADGGPLRSRAIIATFVLETPLPNSQWPPSLAAVMS